MTANDWNAKHPPGSAVRYYPAGKHAKSQQAPVHTTTRGGAYHASSGLLMVPLVGIAGAVPAGKVEAMVELNPYGDFIGP
jgi:hypothetical protein